MPPSLSELVPIIINSLRLGGFQSMVSLNTKDLIKLFITPVNVRQRLRTKRYDCFKEFSLMNIRTINSFGAFIL